MACKLNGYGLSAVLAAALLVALAQHVDRHGASAGEDARPATQAGLLRAATAWLGPDELSPVAQSAMAMVPLGLRN